MTSNATPGPCCCWAPPRAMPGRTWSSTTASPACVRKGGVRRHQRRLLRPATHATCAADLSVLELLDAQPEFTTPIWDYLAALVDDQRISDGQAMLRPMRRHWRGFRSNTASIRRPWSRCGAWKATTARPSASGRLLVSLATLSCFGRRQEFFRGEFFATLKLLQSGDLKPEGLTGSWAGAFGHTQFMPTTYQRIAVDGDGDGRRDLVASIPDALASTANYLKQAGWRTGEPWGYEVKLPAGFDAGTRGQEEQAPACPTGSHAASYASMAPRFPPPIRRRPCCCRPARTDRPSWCSATSTRSIPTTPPKAMRWPSPPCPIACAAAAPLVTPWPTDDPGLGRGERRQLQNCCWRAAMPSAKPDGMIGTLTRRAIVIEQQRLGMQPQDGRAGKKILDALRQESALQPPLQQVTSPPVQPPPDSKTP